MDKWKQIIEDRRIKNDNEKSVKNLHKELKLNDIKDLQSEIDAKVEILKKSLSDYNVSVINPIIREDIVGDIYWYVNMKPFRGSFSVRMSYSPNGKQKFFKYSGYTEVYEGSSITLSSNKWECRNKETFDEVTEDFLTRFSDRILGGY